jgi:perosamine synthetase
MLSVAYDSMRLASTGGLGMWVRKRIEISFGDLCRALKYCITSKADETSIRRIEACWDPSCTFVCLSVRSGFDVLLNVVGWQPGSEVIMSGMTIPDMPRIVRENAMVPVGVDVDLETMGPDPDAIRAAITPRTRAIVVAHLFGGLVDLEPVIEIARQHNLLLIEDCAQAYTCRRYQGDPRADVSMFSFGAIKTNTALAGSVFQVRSPKILQKMKAGEATWPSQSRMSFARRVFKYGLVRILSTRPVCGSIYRIMKWRGSNHDRLASNMARGFAGPGFFQKIRKRPATPLLSLLAHKLESWHESEAERRRAHGQFLLNALGNEFHVLGSGMIRQTWWVFPVLVDHPEMVVPKLWEAGFDGTNYCSLHAIFQDDDSTARKILRHIVFLPLNPDMPKSELSRMVRVIRNSGCQSPEFLRTRADQRSVDTAAAARNGNQAHESLRSPAGMLPSVAVGSPDRIRLLPETQSVR